MSWIDTFSDDDWPDELADVRESVSDPGTGRIDNIMAVHSIDPASLRAHLTLYRQAMRGTPTLPRVDREMIALVVSQQNGCHY